MSKITPCLWFDGDAEAAAQLYCSVFPNSRIIGTTPYGPGQPGNEGDVMTVDFELDGQKFVGLNGGPMFNFTEAISFQIDTADQAETDRYWEALLEGGGEEGPCGWLKDRFGLSWQVVPRPAMELLTHQDEGRRARAASVMFRMKKLNIAEMQAAADDESMVPEPFSVSADAAGQQA